MEPGKPRDNTERDEQLFQLVACACGAVRAAEIAVRATEPHVGNLVDRLQHDKRIRDLEQVRRELQDLAERLADRLPSHTEDEP